MQQVLFTIPVLKNWFPPDGIPIYGFGATLFVTFIMVAVWGSARAKRIGMEPARFQDFAVVVFISGIVGARVLYMVQYSNQYPDKSVGALVGAFFRIWDGGIVFYGSALGGAIGYGLFYWFVMRRMNVSGWQLADAVAPLIAMGLAVGRIGCYLNGCCWGQVANEQVCAVPLGAAHFPLLPAHSRNSLVGDGQPESKYLQTTTGFTTRGRSGNPFEDPRTAVAAVEAGSPAARAGVRPGDRVVGLNGGPNAIVVEVLGGEEKARAGRETLVKAGGREAAGRDGRVRVEFDSLEAYLRGRAELAKDAPDVTPVVSDKLDELARDRPKGKARLALAVERDGKTEELPPFTPETVGLYPTQLYETVSMVLLTLLLLAYYPYRRHDGQLLVLVMVGYAAHRYVNESLRVEPSYTGGLTLSQWGSVVVLGLALAIEAYLWRVMPSRWKAKPEPPAATAAPAAVPVVEPGK
jgi:prolipoprotein diacylglyceryltransferase